MKIDLDDDFDFGFTTTTESELAQPAREEATETVQRYKNALEQMYKAITPLLDNLLVDADTKPIINWPNRKKKIEQFKEKLTAIRDVVG